MYQTTVSGEFVHVHPRLANLLGYSEPAEMMAEIRDVGTQLYANPEQREALLAEIRQRGEVCRRETELRHRDGSLMQVAIYARGHGEADKLEHLRGAIVDLRPLRGAAADAHFREFFDRSTIGMYRSTDDGRFIDVNLALAELLGYPSVTDLLTEVVDISELYVDRADRHNLLGRLDDDSVHKPNEFRLRHRGGDVIWVREFGRSVRTVDGELCFFEGTLQDITEEKAAQAALSRSEAQYRALVDNCRAGVFVNEKGVYTFANAAFEQMLGYGPGELLGVHFKDVYAPESLIEAEARYRARECGEEAASVFETTMLHANGHDRVAVIITISTLEQDGNLVSTGTVTDITEFKRIERQLRHNAAHDPLTGLPNRSHFLQRLSRTMSGQDGLANSYAVLFLDLDGFKVINDSLGHAAGDAVLIEIASRIRGCLNPWDTVSRHGGDEFTILLENVASPSSAEEIARRLRESLAEPLRVLDTEVFTNASIGIVMSDRQYTEAEAILRDADTAMYTAKARGQSGIAVFDKRMHETARLRLRLETDLRLGLERKEFKLRYQPIIDMKTRRIAGFEALLRWDHPTLGELLPGEFLAVAEETGQIVPLGWWVLDTALAQLTSWQFELDRRDLFVSVNLAHRQFHHPKLVERLRKSLRTAAIQPGTLHIELTETIFMDNPELAIERLHAIKQLGVELFLDDFGTGYSSFAHLNQYSVDKLKIDRSFILDDSRRARRIIRSIVQLARALDIELIAEGIENYRQYHYLRRMGIRQGQGFLFHKPLDPAAASAALQQNQTDRGAASLLRKLGLA
ncbi:MAG: EAL domain-containing protein [Gammaproteobacteria bacterium]|nr:EAL domain-containing protein [Gammaproteobacteria bacterium]